MLVVYTGKHAGKDIKIGKVHLIVRDQLIAEHPAEMAGYMGEGICDFLFLTDSELPV